MKIAVNTRFLIKDKLEGIGRFTFEIFQRIVCQYPEHQFYFLFDRKPDPSFVFASNVTPVVLYPPARHPLLWYWWYEISVARAIQKIQAAIFISPDGFAVLSSKIPTLLVVHDIAFEHYPKMVSFAASNYYRYFTPKYCQHAQKIIAVSAFTKNDIATRYNIPSEKIHIVSNGVQAIFKPLTPIEKESFRAHNTDNNRYFIYIGSLHPRKNILGMLAAFEKFKLRTKSNMKLVLAGSRGWMLSEVDEYLKSSTCKNDFLFIGHLENEELARWLGAAEALVYVSFFEGFGIPIIEAMASGVPVITSNRSSMPEVAGRAALIVNPDKVEEISEAMFQICDNKKLNEQCIQNGFQQVATYNWDLSAHEFWNIVQQQLHKK